MKRRLKEIAIVAGYLPKWVLLGVIIGVIAGIGAITFYILLKLASKLFLQEIVGIILPTPFGEGNVLEPNYSNVKWFLLPIVLSLAGLLSGSIVYKFAPEAEGHGTDAVISSFHTLGGFIRARVPIIKTIASVITIGSGGSAGREGPIAQIGAGFASWLASLLKLSEKDRRIMVISGAAAGIGSIFKAPLGGALFAIEVLYRRDFEVDAIIPSFISSVTAYAVFSSIFGFDPIFKTLEFGYVRPEVLPFYVILGIVTSFFGIFYVIFFYKLRDLFKRIKIPNIYKPAIGGFVLGLVGLAVPEALYTGYGWIQLALFGKLAIQTMLIIAIAKILATGFTISSGGSGGVFAPSLVIGGMVGGALGYLLNSLLPNLAIEPLGFILVGMASFFAGAANVPIASMIMVAEMSGNYNLLIPAMLSCSISYLLCLRWSIYESQVMTRIDSPAHRGEFSIDILEGIKVKDVMCKDVITVSPDTRVADVLKMITETGHRGFPVLERGRLVGIVTSSDVLKAKRVSEARVKDIMSKNPFYIHPDESLDVALRRLHIHSVNRLPVVDPKDPHRLVGLITRSDIIRGHEIVRRGQAFERYRDPLQKILVEEVMRRDVVSLDSDDNLDVMLQVMSTHIQKGYPVIEHGELVGMVSLEELIKALKKGKKVKAKDIMNKRIIVTHPDETVRVALDKMYKNRIEVLLVVEKDRPRRIIGMVSYADVLRAYELATP